MMKKQAKGITLIALVITIIILLILAGITINLTVGQRGILLRAQEAGDKTKLANYKEDIELEILDEQAQRTNQNKDELFIKSIENRVKSKDWVLKTFICDEAYEEQEDIEKNNVLVVNTADGYQLVIHVDNHKLLASIEYHTNGERVEPHPKPTGLIEAVSYINSTGYHQVTVNDVKYNLHMYYYSGSQTWNENMVFGDENDVATSSNTTATNMVVVKVAGDLTINSKVEPYHTDYGGPKGFFIYCTGKITNNGEISNNYGAQAVGENVYLWQNEDDSYEFVPKMGANGGTRVSVDRAVTHKDGNGGLDAKSVSVVSGSGVKRATAGGGSGGLGVYFAQGVTTGSSGGQGSSYASGGRWTVVVLVIQILLTLLLMMQI